LRHEMLSHEQLFTCRIFCRANNYLLVAFFVARTNIYLSNFLSREEICFFLFSSWKNDFFARQYFVANKCLFCSATTFCSATNFQLWKFEILVVGHRVSSFF
jgi:hypothetical protein